MPSASTDIAKLRRGRGRPPLPDADLAERRLRIIDAAAHLFFSIGFSGTRLEAIGHRAGVTKRTIYELVGDKQTLFRAACNTLRAAGPVFTFDVPVAGRTARAVMIEMAGQLLAHSLDPALIRLERAVIAETQALPHIVSDVVVEGKANLDRSIAAILDRLIDQNSLPKLDTKRAAPIFYDSVVGARGFRAVFGHPDSPTLDQDLADRVDMFLHGYVGRLHPDDRLME